MGDGRGGAEGRRRRVREDGGLPSQVGAPREVSVHRAVVGAPLGQGESVASHGGRDESLLPPWGVVPVPLLRRRAQVLDLTEVSMLQMEC